MRNTKSTRHTTEAEDEEIESEKRSQDVFELLKTDHRRVEEEGKDMVPPAEEAGLAMKGLGGEVAKRKAKLMQKLTREQGSKKLPSRRKAA